LAGLRIGVLLAQPEVIDLVNRVRNPFNVNDLAQVAAVAALDDIEFIEKSKKLTWEGLDYFYKELHRLKLPYIESQGNFVMFDTGRDVKQVHEALLKRGIILRPINNYGFPTEMRMSVGLPEENRAAIAALEKVLKEVSPLHGKA
jgi:histidinol-phosphate aminotransferase